MTKRLFKYFISLYCVFLASSAFSQDPNFTQYYANPLYLNPAFAGSNICPRVILNYRNQWPAIPGTYVTYNASYDQHFSSLSGGLGLLLYNDRAGEGTLNTTQISLMYSYKFDLSPRFSVRMGLQGAYFQRTLDWSKLTFPDQIDPRYGFIYNTQEPQGLSKIASADFSAGIVGYSEEFWIGFAAHHLIRPLESFVIAGGARLPIKYTLHMGADIPISGRMGKKRRRGNNEPSISPNILFQKQLDFTQLNYGFYFNKYPFVMGTWFRQSFQNPDAFIVLFGFQQPTFKFGYSYDITVSKLSTSTAGSHELSFTFNLPCRTPRKRLRVIHCPSF